ncbi:hypothetical protein QBC41DRAFT_389979 [Cercophora samala]|uniref:Uncharacterized protein n=1 Tax=Cercophora samala TaxID=330535 RepID=A0AA40DB91_9PEZI|nr:hypothetical protein QBC41DRAFT_389979 [Cercophora samala]
MRLLTTTLLATTASLTTALVPRNPEPMAGGNMNLPRDASLPLITSAPNPHSPNPLLARQDRPESPSPCFTEVVTTTTSCEAIGVCTTKPHTSLVCHADYICRSDSQGNPSCMYRESSLGLAGTIIAICFAVALVVSVFSICFLCCKERKEQTRLEKAAEAQKLLKESKVASKRAQGRSVTGGVTGVSGDGGSSGYGSGGGNVNNGGDVGQQTGCFGFCIEFGAGSKT